MTSRSDILGVLEAAGDFVSGEALAEKAGISRAAVWKHIRALKLGGWDIEGARARGYRLVAAPTALSEAAIRARLDGGTIGRRIVVLDVTRSTNSDAMALGREGEAEGTVVIAEEQTAGRGRLGRTWESSRGVNLYLSVLLRPAIAPWKAPQLSLLAGVAVAEAVREEGIDARIKWPNDVVVVGEGSVLRKLAGILTEIEAEADRVAFVVTGIGVNLNSEAGHFSPELAGKATSVRMEGGSRVDRAAFAARLFAHLDRLYAGWTDRGFAAVAPRWRELSVLDGRRVTVSAPGETYEGACAGIDDEGALLLETEGGAVRRVLAGDVTIAAGYGGWEGCR
jgi:BirA family transcriptional regulator, biotin operon repressor / biotin---[acetyl-CoA-carboxylase] ligase